MLNIKCFVVNMVEENCFVVSDETNEAVIIDDGAYIRGEHEAIDMYIERQGLSLKHVLCTHGHFDHTLGNYYLYEKYGLKPEMGVQDADLYKNLSLQIQSIMGRKINVDVAPVGQLLKEGDVVVFGNHKFHIFDTPGHTPGGICFYCRKENVIFVGDSLFAQSIGRTDFPGGNAFDLINSLKTKIMVLPGLTKVYSGHGPTTTIENEQVYNPYLNNL